MQRYTTNRRLFAGIGILHRAVSLAALHDSVESYPQPRCHPETRHKLLEDLSAWCNDSRKAPSILWLHGPAGAGKSAVMITLSKRLQEAQQLGGTFFFKRGDSTRGNAHALFPTIALQLAVNVAELKLSISRVVEENPTLMGRALDVQLRELIVEPCRTVECGTQIILIDGLDECQGKQIQREILRALGNSVSQASLPFRFIIASRPEPHIREVFEGSSFIDLYSPFNIEQSYEDVRVYLESEFARIHREHSTMTAVPNPWPSPDVVKRLVKKSSGYFIYASTVIKFIDDKHYRPTRRLVVIEDTPATYSQSPFAALDALYRQILCAIPETPNLVPILRVIRHFILWSDQIEELLGLESGDVELALRDLHSVISYIYSPSFIHASFGDFLDDPSRAGGFYIRDAAGLEGLARLLLTELGYMFEDPDKNRTPLLAPFLWDGVESRLKQVAPSEDLVHLIRAINLDFIFGSSSTMDAVLSWLQRVEPPPNDLVQIWEEYVFFCSTGIVKGFEPLSEQQSARLMDQLAECPMLLRIFHAYVWADKDSVYLREMRFLLNVSWDELRATLCCLRPIFPDGLPRLLTLSRFIHNSMTNPSTWRANISIDLASGYIRVRKLVEKGDLPEYLWGRWIQWGRFIRGSPCSAELLSSIKEFVPPEVPYYLHTVHGEEECHDVIQWLKSFPEPPLEEIRRWEMLFLEEQRNSCERNPVYQPPNDYDERWRKYNARLPE
ncbi:hypothetical protein B0H14DRAFT_2527353 [Mycena olivaceomarginata]|nr:hypothetical protein B0H14DRAFT_2527353 [Mycena olivaceomarginata]